MRVEINKLHRRLGSTMIFVTHDQVEAMTLADRIVVLRAGVVEQIGTPLDLYNHPANLFVAGFIGSPRMNFMRGQVDGGGPGMVSVRLDPGLTLTLPIDGEAPAKGEKITMGVRPENVHVAAEGAAMLTGEVQIAEQLGGETFVYVTLPGGQSITIEIPGQAVVKPGERIGLSFGDADYHVFAANERIIRRRGMNGAAAAR
jgi:ABC-type sugar transport system ATPase subunit